MSGISGVFTLLGLLMSLALIGYLFYGMALLAFAAFRDMTDPFLPAFYGLMKRKPAQRFLPYLESSFSYFNKLPEKEKVRFLLRVQQFNRYKTYEGRNDLVVTDEMKAFVAASAVQLTFGLQKFSLSHFDTIILYPKEYYSNRTDHYHMGETNSKGIIVLSWADLRDGYAHGDDAVNVGLHEMAHALELQTLLRQDYDEFFGNYFDRWSQEVETEFENVQGDRSSFLRKYAGTNKREFFAVCIEYFFEEPYEFRQHLPQVYRHLSVLLNQDPLRGDGTVEELPIRQEKELLLAAQTQEPLLRTKVSFGGIAFNAVLFLAFSVILVIKGEKIAAAWAGGIVLLLSAWAVYSMQRIVLYDSFFVIENMFRKSGTAYVYDDILAIRFDSVKSSPFMEILRSRKGHIYRQRHFYALNSEDRKNMEKIFRSKRVPLKT